MKSTLDLKKDMSIMSRSVRRMSTDEINKVYYEWLCDLVGAGSGKSTYWLLMNDLHMTPFKHFVPNDDNRVFEAKKLRETFCDFRGIEYIEDQFKDDATMLELIISLAYICEDVMADRDEIMEMGFWFWKMLSNCGLDLFVDSDYYKLRGSVVVSQILDRIINRTYSRNGSGGLFPIIKSRKDQRKVELWYQLSTYLVENYYNEEYIV